MRAALTILAPVLPAAARSLGVARRIEAASGVVLTFDDGPHPEGTPAVLEILAGTGARATFFLVGEQAERHPGVVDQIIAAGHAVALHAYRHRLQVRIDAPADLERGKAVVEDLAGREVSWHRPPYGIYSPAGLEAARASGMTPLLWSRWGKDWRKFTTPERIATRATREVSAGDVILLHDADFYSARGSHRHTVAALPGILSALNRRGLATVLPARQAGRRRSSPAAQGSIVGWARGCAAAEPTTYDANDHRFHDSERAGLFPVRDRVRPP